jgi:hypothetical protein
MSSYMRVSRLQLALSMFLAGSAVGIGLLLRNSFFPSPVRLIQEAYSTQCTVELGLGQASHSAVRVLRGPQTNRKDRPASLLEAEAAIARGVRSHPEDPALRAARGQANLLEWSYEAAITCNSPSKAMRQSRVRPEVNPAGQLSTPDSFPLYVGLSTNIGQRAFGASHVIPEGDAGDDLRFFFGTRLDLGSLVTKLKGISESSSSGTTQ